jgi:membrane associated rhomboid family serine protease
MSAAAIILTLTIVISVLGLASRKVLEKAVLRPSVVAQGNDYATLLTSGFVHADFGHLLFNLITYYSFAFPLNHVMGDLRFEILYFTAMLVSNIGTCIKHRNEPNYASLGASGAILGVLFAAIVYFPTQRLLILPIPVPIPAPLFAVIYLAYSWYSSGRSRDRINHDAHIFGALTGLVFVAVTAPERFRGLLNSIGL